MDEARKHEIDRILSSLRLNPFEVFDIASSSSIDEAKSKYRKLSAKIHPDRCKGELQEKAKQAFALLNDMKEELTDEDKRAVLSKKLAASRVKLIASLTIKEKDVRKAAMSILGKKYDSAEDLTPMPDFETTVSDFEVQLMKQFNEDLIESEWTTKQNLKEISAQGLKQFKEKAAMKEIEVAKAEEAKQWEETREVRASSWKQFQTKNKRPLRPPPVKQEIVRNVKKPRIDDDDI